MTHILRPGRTAAVLKVAMRLLMTAVLLGVDARAQAIPAGSEAAPSGSGSVEALDHQPYRIELHLAFDPSARMDQGRRASLLQQWHSLLHRFVGAPWAITLAAKPSTLTGGDLDSLEPSALASMSPAFDKIWLVQVSDGGPGSGLLFQGREYDTATRKLGPLQRHQGSVLAEAPRALLQFTLDLFSPTALITKQEGGHALLLVRGASLTPASELGRVVREGTVFVPIRLVTTRDDSVVIRRVLFSYLKVESIEGSIAHCAIVSALRDPLTQRISRPNTLAALGIKPASGTLRFRFTTRPDGAPAAGYTLIAREYPEGVPHELGMTDRAGRIALLPGFANQLVILRLLAGNAEPMVEFPVMPGESSEEREIPIDPKPLTVTYQARLDALRDEVIDLVAQRARLEKRLDARLQGDDLAGMEQALKEFAQLPGKEVYAERLTSMKDQATRQQAESKTAVLSKNIQARFSELQALIDRYLDDDSFTGYVEALDRKKAERLAATKGDPARRATAAPAPAKPAPAARTVPPKQESTPTIPF